MLADVQVWATVAAIITSGIAAGGAAFSTWYSSKRKADVDIKIGDQSHADSRTELAQRVLMETIDTMRAELTRQDVEHEEQIRAERERRERAVKGLQEQIDTLRDDHRQCLERNAALERELADLRNG